MSKQDCDLINEVANVDRWRSMWSPFGAAVETCANNIVFTADINQESKLVTVRIYDLFTKQKTIFAGNSLKDALDTARLDKKGYPKGSVVRTTLDYLIEELS